MNPSAWDVPPQILAVDDTPENLQILGETLSRQVDCDLSFASDGPEALAAVKESSPDLILLDVMMPGMSGFEVCKTLKADPATAAIPVIFLTAKMETSDVLTGFELGAVDYILKPFNPPELVARVRTQLRLRQAEAERIRYEIQARRFQKTESLSRMAGAIAHNFNNQLQALMGNLELALCALEDGTDPRDMLASSIQATRKAAELSGMMLTYLGQIPGAFERIDLSAVCRRELPVLERNLPPSVEFNANLPESGPWIRSSPKHVRQVLNQLLANAVEAVGTDPGQIRLLVTVVEASQIPSANRFPLDWTPQTVLHACLEIADTGCGIPKKDIDKIFDPFFTTKFTGRGMGLPVVLGLLRTQGGGATVDSQADQGTILRVFLPLAAEAPLN